MSSSKTSPARRVTKEARARVLEEARRAFLAHGFAGTTMDELARELGMSKKTLYRAFPSKESMAEAIVSAKVEKITSSLDDIMAESDSGFSARARQVLDLVVTQLSEVSPVFLRDLQRFLPHIHRRIENVRREVIPKVWSRLIHEGRKEGLVRDDVDPDFAAEIMLHSMQGILNPRTLDRLHLTPRLAFATTTNLLLCGMLTTAGRREHEKTEHNL